MKKSEIHILIVDDDESIRGSLSQLVERSGFKATAVGTPVEASNLVRFKTFHLAFIDCMLSMTNGIDLAKQLLSSTLKGVPIILMSGIFKDQQFAEEALRKSGATEFLTKPFDSPALIAKINALMAPLLDYKGGSLESLMTHSDLSKRESQKVLDYIENSSGFDLLMIFNILMKSKLSGYLNVTDKNKKLYGFSLWQGNITDVDTLKDVKEVANLIVQMGLVNENEAKSMISIIDKRDPINFLVRENLISPHMAMAIREDKILSDYKKLVMAEQINISFIENKEMANPEYKILKDNFDFFNYEICTQKISKEWFEDYFRDWRDKPIQVAKDFNSSELLKNLSDTHEPIVKGIKEKKSIDDLIVESNQEDVYQVVYYLLSGRLMHFSNVTSDGLINALETKYADLFNKLKNKNAFEVFEFFGSSENPNPSEVENLYKEFAKVNHPDKLPKEASAGAKEFNTKVYSIVSEAYSTLTNAEKRKAFINQLKEKEARVQIRTEENVEKAMDLMDKAQFAEAYELLIDCYKNLETQDIWLRLQWAKYKSQIETFKNDLDDIKYHLGEFNVDERKNPYFLFVQGLVYNAEKKYADAEKFFTRTLEIDKSFLAARRELAIVKSKQKPTSSKSVDLFTGDVTSIISGIFKKKSS